MTWRQTIFFILLFFAVVAIIFFFLLLLQHIFGGIEDTGIKQVPLTDSLQIIK